MTILIKSTTKLLLQLQLLLLLPNDLVMKRKVKEETLLLPSVLVILLPRLDLLTGQTGEVGAEAEAGVQTEDRTEIETEKEKGDRTRGTRAGALKETENVLDRLTDEILHTETENTTANVTVIVIDTEKETEDEVFSNKTQNREHTDPSWCQSFRSII